MADPFDPYSNPIPTSSSSNESNMNVGSAPSAASGGGVRNNPFDFFVGGNANNNAYSYNANPNSNPNAYSENNGSTSAANHTNARNNNNNRNTLQGAPAWQQSARAVMANGSTVWKNSAVGSLNSFSFGGSDAGASGNSVGGGPGFIGRSNSNLGGSGNLSRHSSHGAIRDAKRIVPYSGPIATLESNWDPWLYIANSSSPSSLWKSHGNGSVYLIVGANESCVVRGGVETVLKWARRNVTGTNNGGGNVDLGRMDSLSLNDDRGSTAMQEFEDVGYNSTFGTSYETDANSSVNIASVNRAPGSRGGGGGLNFFRSGLKKAQATFERSVTTMAIRADGGKNPDWICASLHYVGRENGDAVNAAMGMALGLGNTNANVGLKELVSDVCLARTEWLPLPTAAGSTPASPVGSAARVDMSGIKFGIPLCVPDLAFLEAAAAGAAGAAGNIGPANSVGGVRLTVRLYLRSGATLLKAAANAGLKREYCVGESILQYSNVVGLALGMRNQQQQQQQQPASNEFLHSGIINLPFTSGMLAETSSFSPNNSTSNSKIDTPAALQIVATPRIKFNPPCTLGWSLTDPTTMPPTPPLSWLKMFQLPLDQGYVFSLDSSHEILNNAHNSTSQHPNQQFQRRPLPRAILLANERAVESAVVLPLATAVSSILSAAAIQSQQIAAISASRTFRRESIRTHAVTEDMEIGRANAIVDAALKDGCADVDVGVVALVILGVGAVMGGSLSSGAGLEGVPFVKTTMTFQRHDTIFEEALATGSAPMLDEPSGKAYIHNPSSGLGPKEAIKARFCPRILTGQPANDEDATLLPGVMGTKPDGKYVGNIRLEAIVRNTVNRSTSNLDIIDNCCDATSVYDAVAGVHGVNPRIEGYFELEHYLNPQTNPTGGKIPVTVPAIDTSTGQRIGSFLLLIRVKTPQVLNPLGNQSRIGEPLPPASSGLLSVVGMDAITDEIGLSPYFDYDPPSTQNSVQDTSAAGIRRRQVATMGSFLTPQFLRYQADVVRNDAALELANRHDKYNKSIASGLSSETDFDDEANVELFKRRNPKPFRPSNSRGDALLAGIGFNVHVQSLALNILQPDQSAIPAAICHSVTHGAPADHARGFGIQGNDGSRTFESVAEANAARGGLRRLEAKRADIARELETYVSSLINSVGEYFKSRAHTAAVMQQAGLRPTRHVAPNISSISFYRNKTTECAQRLQSLSWEIAVRRGNCFSQALGIAVTSYLTSISDGGPGWRGYANTWLRHGYLITFEGLLSAVGKELGMIEDASVAVEMLRMVHVVLVPDDGVSGTVNKNESSRQRIPVPHSPYVRWVHLAHLSKKGFGSKSMYRLEIGLNQSYYQRRVPEPLKGGAAVRFFPVLYQMGVDIRQWGVNAGRNVTSQIKERNKVGGVASAELGDNSDAATEASSDFNGCGLIDDGDDDDEGGVADNEILMALNVEGFRKMNAYAHSVIPTTAGVTAATSPLAAFYPSEHAQLQPLPPHPILSSLSEAIKTSAGKMEHGVLDKSATACQRLGGGSTVFCKSGKDRTAMQVTFKQAQFLQRLMDKKPSTTLEDSQILYDDVFEHATLMRIHGTRVPICEKNAGEAKYAFNPLQAKFMPEMLKPPPITLAGFLKKPET